MSSDCIERDLGGLIEDFKIAMPKRDLSAQNLNIQKQNSLNKLE
jgi:hypothetical protein